jgi:hypothetical protein
LLLQVGREPVTTKSGRSPIVEGDIHP